MAAIQVTHPRTSGCPTRTLSTALITILGFTDCLGMDTTDMAVTEEMGQLDPVHRAPAARFARFHKR